MKPKVTAADVAKLLGHSQPRISQKQAPRPVHQFSIRDVVQGIGLSNAGRFYTVIELGRIAGRVHLEEHLTGRKFWTFDRYYRLTD